MLCLGSECPLQQSRAATSDGAKANTIAVDVSGHESIPPSSHSPWACGRLCVCVCSHTCEVTRAGPGGWESGAGVCVWGGGRSEEAGVQMDVLSLCVLYPRQACFKDCP